MLCHRKVKTKHKMNGQFTKNFWLRLYLSVYSATHHFKLSDRIGKSFTKIRFQLKVIFCVQKSTLVSLHFNMLHQNWHCNFKDSLKHFQGTAYLSSLDDTIDLISLN